MDPEQAQGWLSILTNPENARILIGAAAGHIITVTAQRFGHFPHPALSGIKAEMAEIKAELVIIRPFYQKYTEMAEEALKKDN